MIKVPSDNNLVMPDSDVIVEYLEKKYPEVPMVASPDVPSGL